MSHLDGFKILILFSLIILHSSWLKGLLVKFQIEIKIFHWIEREFKLADGVMPTIICLYCFIWLNNIEAVSITN